VPTKRTKVAPRRINRDTPEWAERYAKTGEKPPYDTPDHDQWIGWYFFRGEVPGLPPADSDEGQEVIGRRYAD
jgi:hypothetical protein